MRNTNPVYIFLFPKDTAIVFAIEIFSLDLVFVSLVPLLLASIAAVITSYFFIGTDVLFSFGLKASWHVSDFLFYLFLGLGTGIASVYFSKMYFLITHFFDRFSNPYWKMGVAALPIGLLLYFFPPLYGEGYGMMKRQIVFQRSYHYEGFQLYLRIVPCDI